MAKKQDYHTIKTFLKFGSEENIYDLYTNGTIYLNPIQYFRSFEDAELRGDKYEGISNIKNYPPGQLEIPALNFKGNYINFHLKEAYEKVLGNIYSLYCVSSFAITNPFEFAIDERIAGFGSHCLMVKKNNLFLNRIEKALQMANLEYIHNFVSYYDKYTINGKITLFQKQAKFAYQNEFRIYVVRDSTEPLILKLGSLKDIAMVVTTADMMTLKLVSGKKLGATNG